jgi:hypothetical protein
MIIIWLLEIIGLVNTSVNVNITSWPHVVSLLVLLILTGVVVYFNETSNRVQAVSRYIAGGLWNRTAITPQDSATIYTKYQYEQYKSEYRDVLSSALPLLCSLLIAPVLLGFIYFESLPLTFLAGSYLVIGILLGSLPVASSFHPDDFGSQSQMNRQIRQTISVHVEVIFLILAAVMQTAASMGLATDKLLSYVILFSASLASLIMSYGMIGLLPDRSPGSD